jgi:predicted nuclease of predicted toxin-antitoxin system
MPSCRFAAQALPDLPKRKVVAAPDTALMQWALDNGYTVCTHDLDFGTMLALTAPLAPACCRCDA